MDIIEKINKAKLSTHFFVMFTVCIVISCLLTLTTSVYAPLVVVLGTFIGLVISGFYTYLIHLSNVADKFYKDLEAIDKRAKDAINGEQLLTIRMDLREFWRTRAIERRTGHACKEIQDFIDTRMKYEFKIK